jgi:hypothetical protein
MILVVMAATLLSWDRGFMESLDFGLIRDRESQRGF